MAVHTLSLLSCEIELDRGLVRPKTGEPRELTTREADLLRYLASRPSVPISRDELLAQVWGYTDAVVSRACDNTVRRLREKIEADPSRPDHLITVHGTGYRFEPRTTPAPPPPSPPAPALAPPPGEVLYLGERQVDLGRARVTGPGFEAELSGTDVALLRRLLAAGGAVVERQVLLREIWGSQRSPGRAVDHAIRRLRGKIEPDASKPAFLLTASGGYRLEVPVGTRISQEEVLGRAALLAELSDALARSGWVLLVGPPGVGKTTLARAAAARFASVIRVDAGHSQSAAEIVASVGHALGVPLGTGSSDAALPQGADRIGRALAARCAPGQAALLVLDNLEPLPGLVELIAHWRATAPELRALGTSRVRLGVPGERVIEVEPLEEGAAVDLFVRRARAASRSLRFDEGSMRDIRALVGRLGYLPLAIELAAARMPLVSPAGLLARLGSRLLDVLSALRATMESAVSALAPEDREALLALSLFTSSFTLDDAEERLGSSAIDRVAALRDHSMLQVRTLPDSDDIELAVFPILREYAAELRHQLPEKGRALVHAHILPLARLGSREHLQRIDERDAAEARRRQRARVNDLAAAARLAVEIGEIELACDCAQGAFWVYLNGGAFAVGIALGEHVRDACPTRGRAWARLTVRLGQLYQLNNRKAEAERLYKDCEPVLLALEDRPSLANLYRWWSLMARIQGDQAKSQHYLERTLEITPNPAEAEHLTGRRLAATDPAQAESHLLRALELCGSEEWPRRALILSELGRLAMRQGHESEARQRVLEAIEAWRAVDNLVQLPDAYGLLASLALQRGDLAEADAMASEGIALSRQLALPDQEALLLGYQGVGALLRGEPEQAWESLSASRSLLEQWGPARSLGYVELRLAQASLARGDAATASALAARSTERNAKLSELWNAAFAESIWALALGALGQLDEARERAEHAVAALEKHGDPHDQLVGLCHLGQVAASQGDAARWEECLARAEQLARAHALERPRTEAARALAALRAARPTGWPERS